MIGEGPSESSVRKYFKRWRQSAYIVSDGVGVSESEKTFCKVKQAVDRSDWRRAEPKVLDSR
jgi:hypothetical protein